MEPEVYKHYAVIFYPDGKQINIGGWTKESIKQDLADMKRKGLITDDCNIRIYGVTESGTRVYEEDI